MAVDMASIKALREKTGMGISTVKKALEEADGNIEEAEMILRKKGIDKAAKKSDRATGEGMIAINVDGTTAIMIEIGCEQEPTVGNERFVAFAEQVMGLAVSSKAESTEALLACPTDDGTLEDTRKSLVGTMSENVEIKRVTRIEAPAGGIIGQYVHFNKKAGAVCAVALDGASADAVQPVANDICMHAVACRPLALDRDGIDAEVVEKEKEVMREEVKNKPENIQDKILEGKLNKFFSEKVLLEQVFVKDPEGKATVAEVIAKAGKDGGGTAKLVGFARFELGN